MIPAVDQIATIRASLAVFVCGLVGLIPFLGLLPALYALVAYIRINARYHEWNPAARYLAWGGRLALLGVLISLLAAYLVGLANITA